jgi:hypothetical protein
MTRRRGSGPPISLFSFQDIITSVTAILIVITLLLALELVATMAGPAGSAARVAMELGGLAASLEKEYSRQREALDVEESANARVAATGRAELVERIDRAKRILVEISASRERLREGQIALEARETAALAKRVSAAKLREEMDEAARRVTALREKILRTTSSKRVVYAMPRGSEKFAWILVLEPDAAELAPVGRAAQPERYRDAVGVSAESQAIARVAADSVGVPYVLILIRPGSAERFVSADKTLSNLGALWGFDLIGPDEPVLDSETGAWFKE